MSLERMETTVEHCHKTRRKQKDKTLKQNTPC